MLIKEKSDSDPKSTVLSGDGEIVAQDPEWLKDMANFRSVMVDMGLVGMNERSYVESRNDYYHQLRVRQYRWPYNDSDVVEDVKVGNRIYVVNFRVVDLIFGIYEFSKAAMYRCRYSFRARTSNQRIVVLLESYEDIDITSTIDSFLYAVQRKKTSQSLQTWLQSGIRLEKNEWDIFIKKRDQDRQLLVNGVLPNVNYLDYHDAKIKFRKRGERDITASFLLFVVPNARRILYIAEPNTMNLEYDYDRKHRVSYETQFHELDGVEMNLSMSMPDRINDFMARTSSEYVPLISTLNNRTTEKARIVTVPICAGMVIGALPDPVEYVNDIDDPYPEVGVFSCHTFENMLTLESLESAITQFQRRIIDPLPLLNQYLTTDPDLFVKLGNVRYPDKVQATFYRTLKKNWMKLMERWDKKKSGFAKTKNRAILQYFVEYELWEMLKSVLDSEFREIYMYLIKKYFLFYKKRLVIEDSSRDVIMNKKFRNGGFATGTYVYEWKRTKRSLTNVEEPRLRWQIANSFDFCDYQYAYILNPTMIKDPNAMRWKCVRGVNSTTKLKLPVTAWERVNSKNLTIVWRDSKKDALFRNMNYDREIAFVDSDFEELYVDGVKTKVEMPCMFFVVERSRVDPFQDKYLLLNIWTQIWAFFPK